MSDQDEKPATEESGSPMVSDLVGLGKLADSKLVQSLYKDLEKAGVPEQSGKLLTDTIKAFRLFTAPIQLLALGQDLLEKRLERVRNKVPEERQIEAHPQIAGPILQNLRFMVDGDILTEMYLNLLARAIDRDRVGEANPAFVKIIEQLCPDEALLLLKIRDSKSLPYYKYQPDQILLERYEITIAQTGYYNLYVKHLCALNLLEPWYRAPRISSDEPGSLQYRISHILSDSSNKLESLRHQVNRMLEEIERVVKKQNEKPRDYRLTEFGSLFIHACIPEDFDVADWGKAPASMAEPSPEESS